MFAVGLFAFLGSSVATYYAAWNYFEEHEVDLHPIAGAKSLWLVCPPMMAAVGVSFIVFRVVGENVPLIEAIGFGLFGGIAWELVTYGLIARISIEIAGVPAFNELYITLRELITGKAFLKIYRKRVAGRTAVEIEEFIQGCLSAEDELDINEYVRITRRVVRQRPGMNWSNIKEGIGSIGSEDEELFTDEDRGREVLEVIGDRLDREGRQAVLNLVEMQAGAGKISTRREPVGGASEVEREISDRSSRILILTKGEVSEMSDTVSPNIPVISMGEPLKRITAMASLFPNIVYVDISLLPGCSQEEEVLADGWIRVILGKVADRAPRAEKVIAYSGRDSMSENIPEGWTAEFFGSVEEFIERVERVDDKDAVR